jgi:hypothetical protein
MKTNILIRNPNLLGNLAVAVVNPNAHAVILPPSAPNAAATPVTVVVNQTHYFCYIAEKIME